MGKRFSFFLLALFGLVILTGLTLYAFRLPVLDTLISYQLRKHGIPVQSLSVTDASLAKLALHNLSLGSSKELGADTIILTWKLNNLLAGELSAIEINSLELTLDLSGEHPPLGSLQQLFSPAEKKGSGAKLPTVLLQNSKINLKTITGDLIVNMNGKIEPSQGGILSALFEFKIHGPSGRAQGKLAATQDSRGNIQGKVTVSGGSVNLPEAEISGLTGDAFFTLVDNLPQQINADFVLSDINLPGSGLEQKAFEQAKLSLEMDESRAQLKGDFLASNNDLGVLFDATVRDYLHEPTFDLNVNTHSTAGSYIWSLLGLPQPSAGSAALIMNASGQTPSLQGVHGNWINWLQNSAVTGQANIELQKLSFSEKASKLNGKLALKADFSNGSGKAILTDDSVFDVSSLTPSWLISLGFPAELAKLFAQGGRLRIAGKNDKATNVSLNRHADGIELNIAGSANIITSKAQANVRALAQTILDEQGKLTAFKLSDIAAQFAGISYADTAIDHITLNGTIHGIPETWSGKLDIAADTNQLRAGPLSAQQTDVVLPIQVKFDHDAWHIKLRKPGHIALENLKPADSVSLRENLDLSLTQLDVDLTQGKDGLRLRHQIAVAPKNFTLLVEREDAAAIEAQIRPGNISLYGELDSGGNYHGQSLLNVVSLTLPQSHLQLDNIITSIKLDPTGIGKIADFSIGQLQHKVSAPYFAPLSLSGSVYDKSAQGKPKQYSISASGGVAKSQYLKFSGEHSLDSGTGKLQLDIDPLRFTPGGLQPHELLPVFELLENVSGKANASTLFKWSQEGITSSSAVLDLRNISFAQKNTTISGLNGSLQLSDLQSPKSLPQQKITIQRIDLGVPLENLGITYQIQTTDQPHIVIEKADLSLIGGMLSLEPTVIDPYTSHSDMVIQVDNLDLGTLFELIQVEGLTGNGRLDGSIPITLDGKLITIKNGHLAAEAPGILRFKSEKASQLLAGAGKEMELLLKALQEFHYSELTLKLDKSAKNDLVATLSLLGNNPNIKDGQFFRLNINLESNIGKILDTIAQGYNLSNDALRNVFRLR